jgi:hypothetical protein
MTSDSDDLEEAFRENLKLRRQPNGTTAQAALSQRGGFAYRLGLGSQLTLSVFSCAGRSLSGFVLWLGKILILLEAFAVLRLPDLLLYGLGQAFRYVLSRSRNDAPSHAGYGRHNSALVTTGHRR